MKLKPAAAANIFSQIMTFTNFEGFFQAFQKG